MTAVRWRTMLGAVVPLVLFTAASSGVIVVNKMLMVDKGFRFPLFLSACGQLASAVAGWLCMHIFPSAATPAKSNWQWHILHVWPVALCAALTLFLGNYSYLFLSMAFIQILKAFTPACTFIMGIALRVESLRPTQLVSVLAIAMGTCISTLVEQGSPDFHWVGFAAFMASVFTEAARVLIVQQLLSGHHMSPAEASWVLGMPTACMLLLGAGVWEYQALVGRMAVLWQHSGLFAVAMAGSCALNWTSYMAIRTSGALMLKIVGCVKNALVVWVGVLQGEHVGAAELAGYALSVGGFVLYTVGGRGARKTKDA